MMTADDKDKVAQEVRGRAMDELPDALDKCFARLREAMSELIKQAQDEGVSDEELAESMRKLRGGLFDLVNSEEVEVLAGWLERSMGTAMAATTTTPFSRHD